MDLFLAIGVDIVLMRGEGGSFWLFVEAIYIHPGKVLHMD